jgi:hypothetical protein
VAKHIELLGILYILSGALSAVVAGALVALGLGALTIAGHPPTENAGVAAGVVAAAFVTFAIVLAIWSAVSFFAGRGLRKRQRWARLTAFVLAVVHVFILPFGPALAVYTFWVLVHSQVRQEFEPAPHPAGT